MKKSILLLFITLGFLTICNGQTNTMKIKTKGVFKEIDVAKQNEVIHDLQGNNKKQTKLTVDNILKSPNDYNPPVLYALSRELFQQGNKDEAAFWFYVAQLRARYDANLCMDNSAKQAVAILNNEYGPDINQYTFQDDNKLEQTVARVIDFVRTNNENYDHRWINLHGMWAVQAGLDGKSDKKELSQPKAEWPAIKKKTIDDYYNGFMEYMKSKR